MAATQDRPVDRPARTTPARATSQEVLTLAGAARFLRVPKKELEDLATRRELPGRKVGGAWRFLKDALRDWLRSAPPKKDFWEIHSGALKDDPYLDEMLEMIYKNRGRPMIEEG